VTKLLRVGVVGLGRMGRPMAETLARRGHPLACFDLSPERRAAAPSPVSSLSEAVRGSDIVLLSLPSSREVEAVMRQRLGVLESAQPGQVVVDTSTAELASTRRLQAEAAARGVGYVDAPVSGGPKGAADGKLLIMAGGDEADLLRAMPVLAGLAREVLRCGGPGAGNAVKLINNLLCAANLGLAGEALRLGERDGVAPEVLAKALALGSGRSGVTEVNLPTWILSGRFDSGFTMGLMRKDVSLAADLARSLGALGTLGEATAALWARSAAALGDDEDFNQLASAVHRCDLGVG
jgi:3-hydroxyisobutyrate dehydrogenase